MGAVIGVLPWVIFLDVSKAESILGRLVKEFRYKSQCMASKRQFFFGLYTAIIGERIDDGFEFP